MASFGYAGRILRVDLSSGEITKANTLDYAGRFLGGRGIAAGIYWEVISRKGEVIDRDKFEKMKDEYYALRGWDVATGLQTRAQMEEFDLGDIADDLEKRNLLTSI